MSEIESPYSAYAYAVKEQLAPLVQTLKELSATAQSRSLTYTERSAVERCIQVLVEIAIGASKHVIKHHHAPVPSDSYASIAQAHALIGKSTPSIEDLRGAVGMRNAIIHDYLNLDWGRVEAILKMGKYTVVLDYINEVLKKLLLSGGSRV